MVGSNPWATTFVLFFARLSLGASLQATGTLAPVISSDIPLDLSDIGLLAAAFTMIGMVFALPAALLVGAIGDRRATVLGMGCLTLAALGVALAPSLALMLAARLFAGIGAVLISVTMPKIVADQFDVRDRPLALSALMASFPLGIALSLFVMPPIAVALGWRFAMGALVAMTAIGTLACLTLRGVGDARPTTKSFGNIPPIGVTLRVISAGTLWAAFNSALVAALAFGPVFLVGQGLDVAQSGLIVSAAMGGHIVGMLAGSSMERLSMPPVVLMLLSFAGLAVSVALIPPASGHLLLFVAVGFFAAAPVGVAAAMPFLVLSEQARAVGMGWYHTAHYAVLAALPPLAGWAADLSGDMSHAFLIAALFPIFAGCLSIVLTRKA